MRIPVHHPLIISDSSTSNEAHQHPAQSSDCVDYMIKVICCSSTKTNVKSFDGRWLVIGLWECSLLGWQRTQSEEKSELILR